MPVLKSPRHGNEYYLVRFDGAGEECPEDDGTRTSRVLIEKLRTDNAITDIFVISHGWNNDVNGAIRSYGSWIDTMADCAADQDRARKADPNFKPVIVGIHWPSLAFGDETVPTDSHAETTADLHELTAEASLPTKTLVSRYAGRIADDDPLATEAVTAILNSNSGIEVHRNPLEGAEPTYTVQVSRELKSSFDTLFELSGVGQDGAQAAPGSDTPEFQPHEVLQDAAAQGLLPRDSEAPAVDPALLGPVDWIGSKVREAALLVLREMSFWRMKALARTVGESGVHNLVQNLQGATQARFHMMGHSFGCIVITAATCGPQSKAGFAGTTRRIDSLFLVQGAMSLWSFAEKDQITGLPDQVGFYQGMESGGLVKGPIVTTQSEHDWAVGKWYPLGAGLARQAVLFTAELPKYGGLGAYGIRGRSLPPDYDPDGPLLGENDDYDFSAGQIYNLEASAVIKKINGPSGAHSDIAHPRVAHAFWAAAISSFS
ncbi:MAG TPA: hypothetical protein VMA72_28500 [Streptosporangiaceae bacterium]|nr:hypothetical protein [Streptosporangiaceae bacterium]